MTTGGQVREVAVPAPSLPSALAAEVDGYGWMRDLVGESGGAVYRLHAPGRPDLYLKHGTDGVAADIRAEAERLRWFAGRVPVPQVRHFLAIGAEAWLVTAALPGRTAWQRLTEAPDRRSETVAVLAAFLRRLHALPVAECPFDASHPVRLAAAGKRMAAGEVDEEDFGDAHRGWSAAQVWDEMTALLPLAPDPVVTHGDFSLDNILMADGRVTGMVDLGRAGFADRYQDLAILCDCFGEFDAALQAQLFRDYGIGVPDPGKLRFHLCLDEFF